MNTALVTIGFFIVAILGFFVGRWHGMSHRSKELSEALEAKEEELSDLRTNVNEHFSETGRLFTNLTEEYKSLYQHLSRGASELSDESFQLSLAAPSDDPYSQNNTIIDQMNNAAKAQASATIDEQDNNDIEKEVVQPVDYAQAEQNHSDGLVDSEIDSDDNQLDNTSVEENQAEQNDNELEEKKIGLYFIVIRLLTINLQLLILQLFLVTIF